MASEPTFSIVMPAYQAAETVQSAIRSVLSQTRGDFELLVVDDGSSDGTVERILPLLDDDRVQLIRHEWNQGLAYARNSAIARARGKYVSMLDSDDLWLPEYLEVMGRTLAARPDAGLAYTDAWSLDHRSRRLLRTSAMHYQHPPEPPPAEPIEFLAELLERNFVFTSATVPRSVLERVGLYNVHLPSAEDYELWLRIVVRGYPAVRAPGRLAIYRRRPGSLSTNERLMLLGVIQAYDLVARDDYVPPYLRARARELKRAAERSLAAVEGERGLAATAERTRRRLLRVKQRVTTRFLQTSVVPREVEAAFPDLREV